MKNLLLSLLFAGMLLTSSAVFSSTWNAGDGTFEPILIDQSSGGTCSTRWFSPDPNGYTHYILLGLNVGQEALVFQYGVVGLPELPREYYDVFIKFDNERGRTIRMYSKVVPDTGQGYIQYASFFHEWNGRDILEKFYNTRNFTLSFGDFTMQSVFLTNRKTH